MRWSQLYEQPETKEASLGNSTEGSVGQEKAADHEQEERWL